MRRVHNIYLDLSQNFFRGTAFDPEIFYHFQDLEIFELSHLVYGFKHVEEDEYYIKYKRDYPLEVISQSRIKEIGFKNSFDLVDPFESDGNTFLEEVDISFKNGLLVKYDGGTLQYHVGNPNSFFEYTEILLKQYGVKPKEIYRLSERYPQCELYCERPGYFKARVPHFKNGELNYEFHV